MKRVIVLTGAFLCVALGWFGATVEQQAHAQVSPPSQLADWQDMGEANGVRVFRVSRGRGSDCFVTTPAGGISCP